VNYLRAFLSNNTEHDVRNVSGIGGKRKVRGNQIKSGFDKKKGKTNHPSAGKGLDRYYKPEEWRNLSKETKEKIIELRKKRNVAQVTSEKTSQKIFKWKDPVDDDVDVTVQPNSRLCREARRRSSVANDTRLTWNQ
jgi:hypothetical protein